MRVSTEFRRALEAEIGRLVKEARPVFGQGGAAGAAIRGLDQQLQQIDNQATRLDAALPQLKSKYSRMFSEMQALGPDGKKEADRLFRILQALGKAETSLGEFREFLGDAINAR